MRRYGTAIFTVLFILMLLAPPLAEAALRVAVIKVRGMVCEA
jgi:hypothetical protein